MEVPGQGITPNPQLQPMPQLWQQKILNIPLRAWIDQAMAETTQDP